MKYSLVVLFFLFNVMLFAADVKSEANDSNSFPDSSANPIEKIDDTKYRIGNVVLDSKQRVVTLQGTINMEKGLIELLACSKGGKVHESVLVIDAVPYHLQVALLLLGLKNTEGPSFQGDPKTPKGDSVEIWVSWSIEGKETSVRGEDLVWNVSKETTMQHTPWVFIGSKMVEGRFMADQEKSLITTYHDPFTIFDNPLKDGANDELYKVNERIIPPKGTPVTVTIKVLP